MARGKNGTVVQRLVQLTLEPELHARISGYHQAVDPNRYAYETIRELLWIGVNGGDALKGVAAAARVLGRKQAYAYVMSEVATTLKELERRVTRMAAEADANAIAEAQIAASDVERASG